MTKWNELAITEEASKYETRSTFFAGCQPAYRKASALNLLDKLFPLNRATNWNEENITTEASKYKTRTDFFDSNRPAYNAAQKLDLLDKLFPTKEAMSAADYLAKAKRYVLTICAKRHHWVYGDLNDNQWKIVVWQAIVGTARTDGGLTAETFPAFLDDLNAETSWLTGFEFSPENMELIHLVEAERKQTEEDERIARIVTKIKSQNP
jgi:hypothetical protein